MSAFFGLFFMADNIKKKKWKVRWTWIGSATTYFFKKKKKLENSSSMSKKLR